VALEGKEWVSLALEEVGALEGGEILSRGVN
jgi:hypothetical protein